jgi:hypothetical protein
MLGVTGGSAIATKHQFSTGLQRGGNHMRRLHGTGTATVGCPAFHLCRFNKKLSKRFCLKRRHGSPSAME